MQPMVAQFISQTERQLSRSVGASGVTHAAEPQNCGRTQGNLSSFSHLLFFFPWNRHELGYLRSGMGWSA